MAIFFPAFSQQEFLSTVNCSFFCKVVQHRYNTNNELFIFRSFISSLFAPLTIFWLLFIIGFLLILLRKKRCFCILTAIALFWLALISFAPVPNLLCKLLEQSYPPLTNVGHLSNSVGIHILILGSGHTYDTALPANDQLSHNALGRLVEGIRLQRLLPRSLLITSGWQGDEFLPNAMVLKNAAVLLGVPSENVLTLIKPHNTEEEALCYLSLFGKSHKLILVTDAIHMPRAMLLFERVGLNPIAAPTNHLTKKSFNQKTLNFLPSAGNITKMEYAMHEYIGIIWAKLKP